MTSLAFRFQPRQNLLRGSVVRPVPEMIGLIRRGCPSGSPKAFPLPLLLSKVSRRFAR